MLITELAPDDALRLTTLPFLLTSTMSRPALPSFLIWQLSPKASTLRFCGTSPFSVTTSTVSPQSTRQAATTCTPGLPVMAIAKLFVPC
jgi:hypothetical protein